MRLDGLFSIIINNLFIWAYSNRPFWASWARSNPLPRAHVARSEATVQGDPTCQCDAPQRPAPRRVRGASRHRHRHKAHLTPPHPLLLPHSFRLPPRDAARRSPASPPAPRPAGNCSIPLIPLVSAGSSPSQASGVSDLVICSSLR